MEELHPTLDARMGPRQCEGIGEKSAYAQLAPLILFAAFALLYATTPTWNYFGDGITYAFNVEHVYASGRSFPRLFHQNHLLYTVAAYYAFVAARWFLPGVRSIEVLQAGSEIFGALGVAATYHLALAYLRSPRAAVFGACLVGVLAGWWRMATDADAYIVSATLVVWACAVAARWPRHWLAASLVFALAMSTHQLAVLGSFAILFVIYTRSAGSRTARVMRSAAFCAVSHGLAAALYAAAAFSTRRATGPVEIIGWAVSNQGGFKMTFDILRNLPLALASNARLVVTADRALLTATAGGFEIAVLGIAAVCGLACIGIALLGIRRRMWQQWNGIPSEVIAFSGLWLAPYTAFLLVWEPYLTYYRIFYAPAAAILAVAAAMAVGTGDFVQMRRRLAGISVIGLMLANLGLCIRPNMDVRANTLVYQSLTVLPVWSDGGTVLLCGENEADITALYFNPQMRWRHVRSDVASVSQEIDRLRASGDRIWLNACAVTSVPAQFTDQIDSAVVEVRSTHHEARFVELLSRDPEARDSR